MNSYYNYDGIELWGEEPWKDKGSPIAPLVKWIQTKNHEIDPWDKKKKNYAYRTDGVLDEKSYSYTFKDVFDEWEAKGLRYRAMEMGGRLWISMIPHSIIGKWNNKPDILVVLDDNNCKDRAWAMDTIENFRSYNEMAAKDGIVILYMLTPGWDESCAYAMMLQEAAPLYHMSYERLLLDVSTVYKTGNTLNTIPDFKLTDPDGNIIDDADSKVEYLGELKIPVLNIDGIWAERRSLVHMLVNVDRYSDLSYDYQKFIHSETAHKMIEWLTPEYEFRNHNDEGMIERWDKMGLKMDCHFLNGYQWVSFTPKCVFDNPTKKMPVLMYMQEVGTVNRHHTLNAISYGYEYCKLAAQGEFILIMFVLETPDDNDMLHDVLMEAEKIYPIDLSRVYLSGHSHNGQYSMEYMRRHHKELAAMAPLGNPPGLPIPGAVITDDDAIELMSTFDMPLILISGTSEKASMFPISTDAPALRPGKETPLDTFPARVDSWQRRLKASRCPNRTAEEIAATINSTDCVERKLGIPCDKSEVLYMDSVECYIADIKNNDGKYHLRIVGLENMPHTTTPLMLDLAWSYMRRFKRNLETDEIIELY